MVELGLSPEEFRQAVGACAALNIRDCSAPYLQGFLIERLAAAAPELAEKIGKFTAEQVDLLCELIKEQQGLLR